MSCPACGHDLCGGNCPPNEGPFFVSCSLCEKRVDSEDCQHGSNEREVCYRCARRGATIANTHCDGCDDDMDAIEWYQRGMKPYSPSAEGVYLCDACALIGEVK